ncbi:glutathione-regulated potassium-efflux system protein KefC [soil metagenome]
MNSESLALEMILFLAAAIISVPIAHRLGLGTVLGYLIAGVCIGPLAKLWLGNTVHGVLTVSELGVVMMLFLIGLEMQPHMLWRMRNVIVGLGWLQVLATGGVICAVAWWLGLGTYEAVALGMIFALSSTAVALPLLQERGLLKTMGGRSALAVLLAQDLAVIPMLIVLPLLAMEPEGAKTTWLVKMQHAGVVIAAVAGIVLAGRFIVRPYFRLIARMNLQEIFTATALLIVIGIVILMEKVGFSPAMGAFVGGVVLADTEYRHQIEADIEPFKGLLLGIFFVAVGSTINVTTILAQPLLIAGLVSGMVVLKFLVLWALGLVFRLGQRSALLVGIALAQGDEFAFVLLPQAETLKIFTHEWATLFELVVAFSMALTPLLFLMNDRVIQPLFVTGKKARAPDKVDATSEVLLVGFGRFGNIVGRLLKANGVETTILDFDSEQIDTVKRLGVTAYYGDATRPEILRAAGADRARLLLVMVDDGEQALKIIDVAKRNFPQLQIFARAVDRLNAFEMVKRGVPQIYHEMLGSAIEMSTDVLENYGMATERAEKIAKMFEAHERKAIRDLSSETFGTEGYFRKARAQIQMLEKAMTEMRLFKLEDEEERLP